MKAGVKGAVKTRLTNLSGILMVSSLVLFPIAKSRTGNLHGSVVDCENNISLKNVRVVVTERASGTEIGTGKSDKNGYHKFDNLAADRDYELEAPMRSIYEARKLDVRIRSNENNEAPGICLEEEELFPLPSPQIQLCGIFFPLNSKRINYEHKACLDEIALKLQQEPRASLVGDGHSGKVRSGKPELRGISLTRANNARTYLVNEKGVDATRITIRDYTNTCPNTSGDRNLDRRVEFWIVPEGLKASAVRTNCIAGAKPKNRLSVSSFLSPEEIAKALSLR